MGFPSAIQIISMKAPQGTLVPPLQAAYLLGTLTQTTNVVCNLQA